MSGVSDNAADALLRAIQDRTAAEIQFAELCAEGRVSPVDISVFGENRYRYMKACEDVYTAMWLNIVDTGVQVIR